MLTRPPSFGPADNILTAPSLAVAKVRAHYAAAAWRGKATEAGVGGMPTDLTTRSFIAGAIQAIDDGIKTVPFNVSLGGQWSIISSRQQLVGYAKIIADYVQGCFDAQLKVDTAIDAVPDTGVLSTDLSNLRAVLVKAGVLK